MQRALLFTSALIIHLLAHTQETEIRYLSGTGADHTVEWQFLCTEGANSGIWSTIPVPSCWEQEGFGSYNYGHDKERLNESGFYRYHFDIPANWKGKEVQIVFDGVMTDALVKINGIQAGPVHQGAFYRFHYDISNLLRYGQLNMLEVMVDKSSDNESVELAERKADFWIFGGIFRPVYLEVKPMVNIKRVAIDAKADGSFSMQAYLKNPQKASRIALDIASLNGENSAHYSFDDLSEMTGLEGNFPNPALWSAEYPNLYRATFSLYDRRDRLIHTFEETFGFRTIEFRESDGFYVNGMKMKFKGVNRHTFHPKYGRTSSKALSIEAVVLMKEMNMNAVRMSHYPPDEHFLDACDSLGLYVINELTAWQAPSYDDVVGAKLVREMIQRDVNHPSILMWANGNEGGFNYDLLELYDRYDIQKRQVIHPWQDFDGVDTRHYIPYSYLTHDGLNRRCVFMPTEFLHGLYDGGHGAGLDDFWFRMWNDPLCAGGFLWVFADEAIERRDRNNELDTDGNHAPDGILGPYNIKEGSFFTIKEIWSPIHFEKRYITAAFNGALKVENRYQFTEASNCRFIAEWVSLPGPDEGNKEVVESSEQLTLDLGPMQTGTLELTLPESWQQYDLLRIKIDDPWGHRIHTQTWPLKRAKDANLVTARNLKKINPVTDEAAATVSIATAAFDATFSTIDGTLKSISSSGSPLPLSHGPVLLGDTRSVECVLQSQEEGIFRIKTMFSNGDSFSWSVDNEGHLELEIHYTPARDQATAGVSFNYPLEQLKSVKYMGDGPWRVYKNRMKGNQFGVWEKQVNSTITGVSGWKYPEFQGYHANIYWAKFQGTDGADFTVFVNSNDLFLKLYGTPFPKVYGRQMVSYPEGDIAFLHSISSIGTKFSKPEQRGPQGTSTTNLFVPKKYFGGRLCMHLRFEF